MPVDSSSSGGGLERFRDYVRLLTDSMNLKALLAGDDSLPGARIERQERALKLTAALGKLPEDQREAIVLQHWRGCTLAEIAEEMGRTRDAVAGLLRRGMRQLRAGMQDLGQ
jgi:RNA polymerase sigma-70 factor, ECF subfamily